MGPCKDIDSLMYGSMAYLHMLVICESSFGTLSGIPYQEPGCNTGPMYHDMAQRCVPAPCSADPPSERACTSIATTRPAPVTHTSAHYCLTGSLSCIFGSCLGAVAGPAPTFI